MRAGRKTAIAGLHHNRANIVLTGLPRSGTTLACRLLNLLPDTVALHEGPPLGSEVIVKGVPFVHDGVRVRGAK